MNTDGELDPIGDTSETHADVVRCLTEDGYDGMMTIEHWFTQGGTLKGLRQLGGVLKRSVD